MYIGKNIVHIGGSVLSIDSCIQCDLGTYPLWIKVVAYCKSEKKRSPMVCLYSYECPKQANL